MKQPISCTDLYKNRRPDELPWNQTQLPVELLNYIRMIHPVPCKGIDLGCGLGHFTMALSGMGYDMTGVDISPTAIREARRYAMAKKLTCTFEQANVTDSLPQWDAQFDFAFDWEVLHHIYPEQREAWAQSVYNLLKPNGNYLSVCFSESDKAFQSSAKYRTTPIGTTLYFSSEEEIRALFAPLFHITLLKTIEIEGKKQSHRVIWAEMYVASK